MPSFVSFVFSVVKRIASFVGVSDWSLCRHATPFWFNWRWSLVWFYHCRVFDMTRLGAKGCDVCSCVTGVIWTVCDPCFVFGKVASVHFIIPAVVANSNNTVAMTFASRNSIPVLLCEISDAHVVVNLTSEIVGVIKMDGELIDDTKWRLNEQFCKK